MLQRYSCADYRHGPAHTAATLCSCRRGGTFCPRGRTRSMPQSRRTAAAGPDSAQPSSGAAGDLELSPESQALLGKIRMVVGDVVDEKLAGIKADVAAMKTKQEAFAKQQEASDKRLEASDKRLEAFAKQQEASDKRQEEILKQLGKLSKEVGVSNEAVTRSEAINRLAFSKQYVQGDCFYTLAQFTSLLPCDSIEPEAFTSLSATVACSRAATRLAQHLLNQGIPSELLRALHAQAQALAQARGQALEVS